MTFALGVVVLAFLGGLYRIIDLLGKIETHLGFIRGRVMRATNIPGIDGAA